VTGSRDQTAKVWDAATGKELLILGGRTGAVSSVAWSPDGKRLATAGADNAVQLYAIGLRDLIALARQRVSAHPSEENCQKFLHENCPAFPKLSIW
jgi:WD40 repeat protein